MFEDKRNITVGMILDNKGYCGHTSVRLISARTGKVLIKEFIPDRHNIYRDLLISCWNIEIYVENGELADKSFARTRLVLSVYEDEFYELKNLFK